eukprot:TRINITY_DN976_c0_g1_i9.p1 TRINITY_DN976_c0_g1~~TRINITY_DN976_c0_g1_i9.p1  ORF type:complete len:296 (+),score=-22.50 TRINITY_DN976_c0_g1_i9:276-1163(+)
MLNIVHFQVVVFSTNVAKGNELQASFMVRHYIAQILQVKIGSCLVYFSRNSSGFFIQNVRWFLFSPRLFNFIEFRECVFFSTAFPFFFFCQIKDQIFFESGLFMILSTSKGHIPFQLAPEGELSEGIQPQLLASGAVSGSGPYYTLLLTYLTASVSKIQSSANFSLNQQAYQPEPNQFRNRLHPVRRPRGGLHLSILAVVNSADLFSYQQKINKIFLPFFTQPLTVQSATFKAHLSIDLQPSGCQPVWHPPYGRSFLVQRKDPYHCRGISSATFRVKGPRPATFTKCYVPRTLSR